MAVPTDPRCSLGAKLAESLSVAHASLELTVAILSHLPTGLLWSWCSACISADCLSLWLCSVSFITTLGLSSWLYFCCHPFSGVVPSLPVNYNCIDKAFAFSILYAGSGCSDFPYAEFQDIVWWFQCQCIQYPTFIDYLPHSRHLLDIDFFFLILKARHILLSFLYSWGR